MPGNQTLGDVLSGNPPNYLWKVADQDDWSLHQSEGYNQPLCHDCWRIGCWFLQ